MSRQLCLLVGVFLIIPASARSQLIDDTSIDDVPPPNLGQDEEDSDDETPAPDPFGFGEEFSLEARDRVISAARTETTIQEAPAIVTVITRDEIRARGFRTLIEVLASIPGFEGPRAEGTGWLPEAIARGNPRTVLVLLNGLNVVDPTTNIIVLDRKIPLAIVDRIEVISGPGGVLWGSNALLGVVNITTIDGRDHDGWSIRLGGGHGPGELGAAEANLTFGRELADDVFLLANLNFFTSRGAELTLDTLKFVGALPAPAPDGVSLFLPESYTTDPSRDYFASGYFNLRGGPLTLIAFVGWERDRRQFGFGGSPLTTDLRSPEVAAAAGDVDVETVSEDPIWAFSLNYRDRFVQDDFGFSATGYFIKWKINEAPFGSFPPSDVVPRGLSTEFFDSGEYRSGVNLDADYRLPENNHLVFGAEFFVDILRAVRQTFPEDAFSATNDATFTDTLVTPVERLVGALYLSNEWRASDVIALNAGVRLQASNTYDPTVLLAGAVVWNAFGETFLKLNYTEGFRPPNFQATDVNPDIRSGVTFQANPNLDVERSRAIETEINTVLLEDTTIVDRWFLRADYSFTVLDQLIQNVLNEGFVNGGTRVINSVEVLSRLTFVGQHELSLAYYYVDAQDDDIGPIRNIANHIVNSHARVQLVPDMLHFSADLSWIGPREDANRRVEEGEPGEPVSVFASDVHIEQLDPVLLVRAGFRAENVADHFDFGVFAYNLLNTQYGTPDIFFDDRVEAQPHPMPGWSIFATAETRF